MNYERHYALLMERARSRRLAGYVERHHVHPTCMGGTDDPENIVRLTPEEHYVAHQLLVKMHPGNLKLLWAAWAMCNASGVQVRNNRMYGWLRRRHAIAMSVWATGRKHTPETLAKMSAARRGKKRRPHSDETRAKMSAASLGKPKSAEHRAALAAAKLGKKRAPHTEATRAKMRASQRAVQALADRSHMQTPEYREKQRENMRRIWAERRQRKAAGM